MVIWCGASSAVGAEVVGWLVAGVGDAVGDGLLDRGQLVANAGQEPEVGSRVVPRALGEAPVGPPGEPSLVAVHPLFVGGRDDGEDGDREPSGGPDAGVLVM